MKFENIFVKSIEAQLYLRSSEKEKKKKKTETKNLLFFYTHYLIADSDSHFHPSFSVPKRFRVRFFFLFFSFVVKCLYLFETRRTKEAFFFTFSRFVFGTGKKQYSVYNILPASSTNSSASMCGCSKFFSIFLLSSFIPSIFFSSTFQLLSSSFPNCFNVRGNVWVFSVIRLKATTANIHILFENRMLQIDTSIGIVLHKIHNYTIVVRCRCCRWLVVVVIVPMYVAHRLDREARLLKSIHLFTALTECIDLQFIKSKFHHCRRNSAENTDIFMKSHVSHGEQKAIYCCCCRCRRHRCCCGCCCFWWRSLSTTSNRICCRVSRNLTDTRIKS